MLLETVNQKKLKLSITSANTANTTGGRNTLGFNTPKTTMPTSR